jgi:myo-inositol-1(or 4)-monophosphatase
MSEAEDTERARVALAAARAGGEHALAAFRGTLDVETKSNKTDVVTRIDRESQARVIETIRETFPEEPVVGEEPAEGVETELPAEGPAWVVDPIDGTNNYVRGLRLWATSVAAVIDGEPVAAANVLPALGDSYRLGPGGVTRNGEPVGASDRSDPETFRAVPLMYWERDRRAEYATVTRELVERFDDLVRYGSAQAALSFVADGGVEVALTNVDANPWDTVAGVGMVRAAGGTVTTLEGERWRFDDRGLVASNGRAHEEALAAARAADAARE